jgi:predicted nucleotidyltransferase
MREHHQRTIDRLVAHFEYDPAFPALIIAGSIARGWEKDDSDVDIIFIASDEEYARRLPKRELHYFSKDFSDHPGVYVDGKILDLAFLKETAERGSEPARAAFKGAIPAYSRLPELEDILKKIPIYPESQRMARIQSFYAQVQAMLWYVGEAEKRNDPYLLRKMSADLVLFGGRLILAHNRILFPFHKWFMKELERAPDKPDNLIALAEELLALPNTETAETFARSILDFSAWDVPPEGWPARFMEDTEWTWRKGWAPIADC